MPTKEQQLQSLLLRLAILVATSLSTISQPVPPHIINTDVQESTSSHGAVQRERLRAQILGDTRQLFTAIQKSCTNLTLALRPEQSIQAAPPIPAADETTSSAPINPTSGLRDSSIDAAAAQLSSIMNDAVPKLIYLSRKASSDAVAHRYCDLSAMEKKQEEAEHAFVKAQGGHIVKEAHAIEGKKLQRIANGGLGQTWAKRLGETVFELLQALGSLSQAYMDERTLLVLDKAAAARDTADGFVKASVQANHTAARKPCSIEEARRQALQATAVVWEICNAALTEGSGKLLSSNRDAVQQTWRRRTELLQDSLRELNEGIEGDSDESGSNGGQDDVDDPFAGLDAPKLPENEREQARRFMVLLKAGCRLHAKIGEHFLSGRKNDDDPSNRVDLDDLNQAGDALEEAVCDMTSALLYGDVLPGADDADSDRGSQSSDDDGQDTEVEEVLKTFMTAVENLQTATAAGDKTQTGEASLFAKQSKDVQNAYVKLGLETTGY